MKIWKNIEAYSGRAPYWFEHHPDSGYDANLFDNDSRLLFLDCGEILELREWGEFDAYGKGKEIKLCYVEKYINPDCEDKENIWKLMYGCKSAKEFSNIYPSKKELIEDIENDNIIWINSDPYFWEDDARVDKNGNLW